MKTVILLVALLSGCSSLNKRCLKSGIIAEDTGVLPIACRFNQKVRQHFLERQPVKPVSNTGVTYVP